MEIIFDEVGHTYTNKFGEVLPNPTTILGTVYGTGLENAPVYYVDRASAKGTKFHKEVHGYLTTGKQGTTKEFNTWHEWYSFYDGYIVSYESEKIVYAHTPSGSFAGTLDFLANGFVYDWKTCKAATKKQIKKWQMQLSFYIYAARQMGYAVNEPGKIVHVSGDELEIINVDYLGDEWVENTMALYKDILEGRKTQEHAVLSEQKALEKVSDKDLKTLENTMLKIVELEKQAEEIKSRIKEEMGRRGIYQLEIGSVKMTYVSEHTSKKFDSTKFKAEHADLYKKYIKESPVKASLRVTIKENENE